MHKLHKENYSPFSSALTVNSSPSSLHFKWMSKIMLEKLELMLRTL